MSSFFRSMNMRMSKMLQDCHDLLKLTEWKDIIITNDGDEMSCMQDIH